MSSLTYSVNCFRAVGRAVRHKGDYSAIILVDSRYTHADVRNDIAKWVRDGLEESTLEDLGTQLSQFFNRWQSKATNPLN
jgi:Rad3-related DNA helicase